MHKAGHLYKQENRNQKSENKKQKSEIRNGDSDPVIESAGENSALAGGKHYI